MDDSSSSKNRKRHSNFLKSGGLRKWKLVGDGSLCALLQSQLKELAKEHEKKPSWGGHKKEERRKEGIGRDGLWVIRRARRGIRQREEWQRRQLVL